MRITSSKRRELLLGTPYLQQRVRNSAQTRLLWKKQWRVNSLKRCKLLVGTLYLPRTAETSVQRAFGKINQPIDMRETRIGAVDCARGNKV